MDHLQFHTERCLLDDGNSGIRTRSACGIYSPRAPNCRTITRGPQEQLQKCKSGDVEKWLEDVWSRASPAINIGTFG